MFRDRRDRTYYCVCKRIPIRNRKKKSYKLYIIERLDSKLPGYLDYKVALERARLIQSEDKEGEYLVLELGLDNKLREVQY